MVSCYLISIMDFKYLVGKRIRIASLAGEVFSDYGGREGVVEYVDAIGQLHGTWGGLAVIPGVDDFEVLEG